MITENININTFNAWALKDKDEGMEKGHAPSVNIMFDLIEKNTTLFNSSFKAIDFGCGNGWVIKKFLSNKNCKYALGIDGAPAMIDKAKKLDLKNSDFINADIEEWKSTQKFDIIFSMETFYYFKNINKVLSNIYNNIISDDGFIVMGIDHYLENKASLSWDKEFNLSLNSLSISDWINIFQNNGFKNVQSTIYGAKENWNGTLILYGNRT